MKHRSSIYDEMLLLDSATVSKVSKKITEAIKDFSVSTNLMAIASLLICWSQKYGIEPINVFNLADGVTHSGDYNNLSEDFVSI